MESYARFNRIDFTGSYVLPRRFTVSAHTISHVPASYRGQSQRLPGSYCIVGIYSRNVARQITLTEALWPNYTSHLIESHTNSARAKNRYAGDNGICHACQVNEAIFRWVGNDEFSGWESREEALIRYNLYLRQRRPIMSSITESWMAPTPCAVPTPS